MGRIGFRKYIKVENVQERVEQYSWQIEDFDKQVYVTQYILERVLTQRGTGPHSRAKANWLSDELSKSFGFTIDPLAIVLALDRLGFQVYEDPNVDWAFDFHVEDVHTLDRLFEAPTFPKPIGITVLSKDARDRYCAQAVIS